MNAYEIAKRLRDKGFESFFVGGFVRDKLMGIKSKDIDVVTNADPNEIREIFKDCSFKAKGKKFLVSYVDNIEVATYRKDTYHGLDSSSVDIEKVKTLEEDVSRRDLTINAIAMDPFTGDIYDYVNGIEDLKNKIIRFVGEPRFRIWEDPNRIIRACRFYAMLDGTIEENTFTSLKENASYVSEFVDVDRIRLEILKAMKIKKASLFFRCLYDIDVLEYIFPSLHNCWAHEHGKYHIEDVFYHNMMAGDSVSTKYPFVKLASYLHDVGKPIACDINPLTNEIWFKGHDDCGADAVRKELDYLGFSGHNVNLISNLIRLHMRISNVRLTPKAIRRTLKMLEDAGINYKDLLRLSISDRRGNFKTSQYYGIRDAYELLRDFKKEIEAKPPDTKFSHLALNGYEIMELTGFKPGKDVGKVKEFLLDKVLDDPGLNTKEKLTEFVLQIQKGVES